MMRIDLHAEDLLERAARGTASDADWTRLEQHLAECAVCRVERALSAQAALDAAPLRDEKLVVARLKRAVAVRLASPSASRARRKSTFVAVALAAGALCSVAAAATLVIVRRAPAPLESAAPKPLVGVAPVLANPRPMKAEQPRGVATGDGLVRPRRVVRDGGDSLFVQFHFTTFAQPTDRFMMGDAVDPGLEAGAAAVTRQPLEDAEKDLLAEVLGQRGVAGQAQAQVVDHGREAVVDLAERRLIADAVANGEGVVEVAAAR